MLRPITISWPSELRTTLRLRICDLALVGGFEERRVDHLRRAAHVEGAHGELGARLADRLRRDDADGLAHG